MAFFGLIRNKLTLLERALIDALSERLPQDARLILERQVAAVRRVSRLPPDEGESCFWMAKTVESEPSFRFPNRTRELLIATVHYTCADCRDAQAKLFAVDGTFFDIEFTPSPAHWHSRTDIRILSVEIHADLMKSIEPPVLNHNSVDVSRLRGRPRDWLKHATVIELPAPLPREDREARIKQIRAKLPDDYVELTEQCEGFAIDKIAVLGLADAYEVHLPQGDYWVLATTPDGVIAEPLNANRPSLHFVPYDGGVSTDMGPSLQKALSWVLSHIAISD